MTDHTQLLKRVVAARTAMLLTDPFFGSLALRLQVTIDPTCPTAWTDGTRIGLSPEFAATLDDGQLRGLLAHEVMHCALGHPWRRDAREPRKWNIACDKAINTILQDAKYFLPPDGYYCEGAEVGQSAEWIYARMPDSPDGEDGWGEVRDAASGTGGTAQSPAMSEADWKQAVQVAAQQAKRQGALPAGLARLAKDAVAPRVNWRAELRLFVERAKSDYSYARPNPRYTHMGIYLPSLDAPETPAMAVCVDTSGSMDDTALAAARGELEAIAQDARPAAMHVLYADAGVAGIDTFTRDESIEWRPRGGGGTDFRPALTACDTLEPPPVVIVYITDLYGTFPDVEPLAPVVWLTTTRDAKVPFGRVIVIED